MRFMNYRLKITRIGNSLGLILPKEVAAALGVEKGDNLNLASAEGGFRITPYDAAFEKQMQAARKIMKKRRKVLRELAK
jgi:putative addiction module antidote